MKKKLNFFSLACDCGAGASCTFEKTLFSDEDTYCICTDGSIKNTPCEVQIQRVSDWQVKNYFPFKLHE
ncbi:hypothetical protein NPIL_10811 [Nephila pilipes]|uniref:Uncharacterized protein n=1 Tax=Nephila pilipes TaxID=299642 RepID=A0A8X6PS04_NEPPI|nr:hypothetical protein NPIL_10811 [Nephila pilipes]